MNTNHFTITVIYFMIIGSILSSPIIDDLNKIIFAGILLTVYIIAAFAIRQVNNEIALDKKEENKLKKYLTKKKIKVLKIDKELYKDIFHVKIKHKNQIELQKYEKIKNKYYKIKGE